jgi:hypothetical protein
VRVSNNELFSTASTTKRFEKGRLTGIPGCRAQGLANVRQTSTWSARIADRAATTRRLTHVRLVHLGKPGIPRQEYA